MEEGDHVTWGTMIAVIANLVHGKYKEETSNVERVLEGDLLEIPLIPETVNHCDRRIRASD